MKKLIFILLIIVIICNGYSQIKKTRIALINFNATGIDETTVRGIEENLLTEIINTGKFEVVERTQLNKVLQELNLSNSDEFNEATAAKVGNLLGVDIILIGSVNKIGKNITINVRGIEVKTGLAIFARKVITKSEEEILNAIENLAKILGESEKIEDKDKKDKKTSSQLKLSNLNIGGIAVLSTGSVILVGGGIIFTIDMLVIGPDTLKAKASGSYATFKKAQDLDLALFSSGIALMGTGATMMFISIPLLATKETQLSLNFGLGSTTTLGFKINF